MHNIFWNFLEMRVHWKFDKPVIGVGPVSENKMIVYVTRRIRDTYRASWRANNVLKLLHLIQ